MTGLHQAEQQIAEWLAWEEIETSSQFKELDSFQQKTVRDKKRDSLKAAQTAVKNAYELVLYLEKDGSIQSQEDHSRRAVTLCHAPAGTGFPAISREDRRRGNHAERLVPSLAGL